MKPKLINARSYFQMLKFIILLVAPFFALSQNAYQFVQVNEDGYELSAICSDDKGNIYVAADNGRIDKLDCANNRLHPIKHSIVGSDIEALDFHNGLLWYAVERNHRKIETIDLKSNSPHQPKKYKNLNNLIKKVIPISDNSSIEAFAIDSLDNKIYFSKERDLRTIFYYSLGNINDPNSNSSEIRILDLYRGESDNSLDISDMKIEYNSNKEPILHILERFERQIRSYNIKTQKTTITSFKDLVCDNQSTLFYNTRSCSCDCFGLAEALLVTESEFWIGFDNNGDPINESFALKKGYKKLKGNGNKPLILKLKR